MLDLGRPSPQLLDWIERAIFESAIEQRVIETFRLALPWGSRRVLGQRWVVAGRSLDVDAQGERSWCRTLGDFGPSAWTG